MNGLDSPPGISSSLNRVLVGHTQSQKYLHPNAWRSSYDELRTWLSNYSDHPNASRISWLAKKRKPKSASNTKSPKKGYLNGVQFGVGQGSKLWGHGGDIAIGRNRDTKFHTGDYNTAKYFDGVIDEVRLWNIERTQNQISAKKDTVLEGNESGLTAYYNFQI